MLVVGCSAADADASSGTVVGTVDAYDAALDPLKKRSDVLEQRFAEVQGEGYTGPEEVRDVLAEILPEFAELLEETRAIDVEEPALQRAHLVLVDSLEKQQKGLELALEGLENDDMVLVAQGGRALQASQRLVKKHRRLLARARAER